MATPPTPASPWIEPDDLLPDPSDPSGDSPRRVWKNYLVVVKVLLPTSSEEIFAKSVQLWRSFSHPNVIKIFGSSRPESDPLFLVIPAQKKNGNINQFIAKNPNTDKFLLIRQCALGMHFLHNSGIIHGSLKPTNILIDANEQAIVSDFGVVALSPTENASSRRYLSPEAWKGTVSRPADVFAFAMSIYEIFTQNFPWGILYDTQIYQLVVRENERPDRPDPTPEGKEIISDYLWDLIEECWHKESRLRPRFDHIIERLQNSQNSRPLPPIATETGPKSQPTSSEASTSHSPPLSGTPTPKYLNEKAELRLEWRGVQNPDPEEQIIGPPAYNDSTSSMRARASLSPPPSINTIVARASLSPPPSINTVVANQAAGYASLSTPPTGLSTPPIQLSAPPIQSSSALTSSTIMPSVPEVSSPAEASLQEVSSPVSVQPSVPLRSASLPAPDSSQPVSAAPSSRPANPGRSLSPEYLVGKATTAAAMNKPYSPPPMANRNRGFSTGASGYFSDKNRPRTPKTSSSLPNFTQGQSAPPIHYQSSDSQSSHSTHNFTPITPDGHETPTSLATESGKRKLRQTVRRSFAITSSSHDATRRWNEKQRLLGLKGDGLSVVSDEGSKWGETNMSSGSSGGPSAFLLVGALQTEMSEDRDRVAIDEHLLRIHKMANRSNNAAQKLITAGAIPLLIKLLKTRAADANGLELVLLTLGVLAHDSISANTIWRTQTIATLIEIFNANFTTDITALSIWCLNRISRSPEIAAGLVKQGLATLLIQKGFLGAQITARLSAWCLGTLTCTDALAEVMESQGLVITSVDNLRNCASSSHAESEDICAAIFCIARMARSIKLSKALAKAGCIEFLVYYLKTSEDPQILYWTARAIGCLMRPNSSDMAKALLAAGTAEALARLPRVLPTEEIEPLGSFAFAIQRFSCAEWGGGTRKALVEAGVVDSLLAALRTAVDVPYPHVHKELALAVSFLGDVGGGQIRKEIINAGGVDILKRVAAAGKPDVAKACALAVTTITGNIWSRNKSSAKTAMTHVWIGGCPEHQPVCPLNLVDDSEEEETDESIPAVP